MINLEQITDIVNEVKISYEPSLSRATYRGKRPVRPYVYVKVEYDVAADFMLGENLDQGWFAEW